VNRDFKKAKRIVEDAADTFWESYCLMTTFHGRRKVQKILDALEKGTIEMDPKVAMMYSHLLDTVPYQLYATLN